MDWQAAQDTLCPGCGEPKAESMHPDSEGRYLSEAVRCFACQAREGEAKAFRENGDPAGVYYSLRRL